MKRTAILTIFLIFVTGCAPTYHFLDIEDTVQFNIGMTKSDVKNTFGIPMEARAGLKLKSGDTIEIWTYLVKRQRINNGVKSKRKPGKNFKSNDWNGENTYVLVFQNGELIKWGHSDDDWKDYSNAEGDIVSPISTSKGGLFGGVDKGSGGGILSKIPLIGK